MKKYTKPTVEVVSLKSSNDIAASFKLLRRNFVNEYLNANGETIGTYSVTKYSTELSVIDEVDA